MKTPVTIGERICAAVLAHQLGISTDRAYKLYVRGQKIDPSWQRAGEALLEKSRATSVRESIGPPESGNLH